MNINDERDAEIELLRQQLTACGVIAMCNTKESAEKQRQMKPEYRCFSVEQVEKGVDREMFHRERADAAEANLAKAVSALQDLVEDVRARAVPHNGGFQVNVSDSVWHRANDALREIGGDV